MRVALLCAGLAVIRQADAQVGAVGGAGIPSLQPPPVATDNPDVFANPGRTDDALIAGAWLVYPSAFIGGIYDTNVNQSSTNARSSGGVRLAPSLLAVTDGDLTKTTLYGVADGRIYANSGANDADAVDVNAGIIQLYQPLPDLTFTAQGDYTRQKDLFSTLGNTHSVQNLNPTGIGLSPVPDPQAYNQLSTVVSVQKNFANAFTIATGSVVGQIYDQNTNLLNQSANNVTFTGGLRGGVWLRPAIYGYVEGAGDSRSESISGLSSSGYRIVGGFGSDQIGLVRGEIFGGYQSESYSASAIGSVGSSIFGAKGFYYPLPELTLNLAVDEQLGVSLLEPIPGSPGGTATRVLTALATADYAIAQLWSVSGRGGYIRTDYVDNPRRDDAWTFGGTLTYELTRNLGATADYQHVQLNSNVAQQSFDRDIVTVGLTVKY